MSTSVFPNHFITPTTFTYHIFFFLAIAVQWEALWDIFDMEESHWKRKLRKKQEILFLNTEV